jgi:hypothetical protein
MKNLFSKFSTLAALIGVGLVLSAGAFVFHSSAARAITVPYSQQPRIGFYQEAGLNIAAGAVINSPVYDLSKVSECTIVADNSAGAASRALTSNWIASDGTTVLFQSSVTVTNGTRALVVISPTASTASLPAGVTAIPSTTGKKMSFSLAAAGAAVGSLVIYCQ